MRSIKHLISLSKATEQSYIGYQADGELDTSNPPKGGSGYPSVIPGKESENYMIEEEFKQKLKELCLRYDLKHGESFDPSYIGTELYEFYCDENELDPSEFMDYMSQLNETEPYEEPIKEVEYFVSDEEIKIGDTVCIYEDVNNRWTVIDKDGEYLYVKSVDEVFRVVESQFKKVEMRDK